MKIYIFLSIYARDSDNDSTPVRRNGGCEKCLVSYQAVLLFNM